MAVCCAARRSGTAAVPPDVGSGTSDAGSEDQSGDAGQSAQKSVNLEDISLVIDAREPCCIRIAANRVKIAAEGRRIGQKAAEKRDRKQYQHWDRNALVGVHYPDKRDDPADGDDRF